MDAEWVFWRKVHRLTAAATGVLLSEGRNWSKKDGGVDAETVIYIFRVLAAEQERPSEMAPFFWMGLMLAGVVCGAMLARWIFGGGLSRARATWGLRG